MVINLFSGAEKEAVFRTFQHRKDYICTFAVTVCCVVFFNASTNLEHQFPHCPVWDTH